jgi:hypothetical protein
MSPFKVLRIADSFEKPGLLYEKQLDIIIATFCIIEGLTLLHDDRDFDPMASHFPLKAFILR